MSKMKISCYRCERLGVDCAAMRTPDEECFKPKKVKKIKRVKKKKEK